MRSYTNVRFYRRILFEVLTKIIFIIYLSLSYGAKLNAAEITCSSGRSPAAINFEIAPVNLTVNKQIPNYTLLYTIQSNIIGNLPAYCYSTPDGGKGYITATLQDVTGTGDTSQSGYIIFPSNVNGIGISINSTDAAGKPAIPAWPASIPVADLLYGNTFRPLNVEIRLWKIPGDIPEDTSPFGITGPTVVQGVSPATTADFLAPSMLTTGRSLSPTFWIFGARSLIASANYYIGTCNLQNGNQTVLMGKHFNFERLSAWRDASFTIECPVKAWGYGGKYNFTPNNPNKAPTIKITPYSNVVLNDDLGNQLSGTIALDPGGAQGYGVQLAWGDYATQTTGVNPSNPVPFNTSISVSALVSGYPTTVNLGTQPLPALIKMAARFIQIDAIPHPGRARAAIEVIVNYE